MNQDPLFGGAQRVPVRIPVGFGRVPEGAHRVPNKNPERAPGQTADDKGEHMGGCPRDHDIWLPSSTSKITSNKKSRDISRTGEQFVLTGRHRAPGLIPATIAGLRTVLGAPGWRGLTPRRCRTCGNPILTGLDADMCAALVDVDWTPLDPAGELQALIWGLATYQLRRESNHLVLVHRTPRLIRHRPPGGRDWTGPYDVIPAHRCPPAPLPATTTRLITPPATTIEETTCPF